MSIFTLFLKNWKSQYVIIEMFIKFYINLICYLTLWIWLVQSTGGTIWKNKYTINFETHQSIQQEVDKILDKINSEGFGALNQREKSILEKAKNLLKK